MEKEHILFESASHKVVMFSVDDEEHEGSFLAVNQFLIVHEGYGILIDPGSDMAFDEVSTLVENHLDLKNIKYIFFSHQDPDVAGSIAQWSIACNAQFLISKLWPRFMSHYGLLNMDRITPLGDEGAKISFDAEYIEFVPAHFLHSPGNFSLYDSQSKILFSGDIGAALVPPSQVGKTVEDFERHIDYMQAFHARYMHSNKMVRKWVKRVKDLDVQIIAPQHGSIFGEEHVFQFLGWFENLECGSDLMD